MQVSPLPTSFSGGSELLPPVYADHWLYFGRPEQAYIWPEHTAGIGLLLAAQGSCAYTINSMKNQVGEGQVFFVNRGSKLALSCAGKGNAPLMLFFDSRLPDLVQYSMQFGGEVLPDQPFDSLPFDFSYLERLHVNAELCETVLSLIPLGSDCSAFAALRADIIVRTLFEKLLRDNAEAYQRSHDIRAVKASTRVEVFKRVSLVREWMEQHFQQDVSLDDLAGIAAMNSQHFLRMFKQAFQVTPHQYLIELKLKEARLLLENTDCPIGEVCRLIGFESVFSFSVLFKKRFGMPPSQFRAGE